MAREWWSAGFFDMEMAGALFTSELVKKARGETARLIRLAGLKKSGRILDAACGLGRHSLEFARRGYRVTGVDISQAYLAEARRQARRLKRSSQLADFQRGELADLGRFQNSCDLVLNLYTSFGYYGQARDNLKALRQMALALKKGGRLVMELLPRETLELNFMDRDWEKIPGGYLLHQRAWVRGGRKLAGRHLFIKGKRQREARSELFIYSKAELAGLFKRAGLKSVKAYGGFDGSRFKAGDRLVMVGIR